MIKQEDTDRKENRHDNMHIQYKDCLVLYALKLYTSVHKQTDTHKHSHTYTHTQTLAYTFTHSHTEAVFRDLVSYFCLDFRVSQRRAEC